MRIEDTQGIVVIHCGNAMDISTVVDQKDLLIKALALQKNSIIKTKALESLDVAGIQLLLAFVNELEKTHRTCVFEDPSERFVKLSETLGLKTRFLFSSSTGESYVN